MLEGLHQRMEGLHHLAGQTKNRPVRGVAGPLGPPTLTTRMNTVSGRVGGGRWRMLSPASGMAPLVPGWLHCVLRIAPLGRSRNHASPRLSTRPPHHGGDHGLLIRSRDRYHQYPARTSQSWSCCVPAQHSFAPFIPPPHPPRQCLLCTRCAVLGAVCSSSAAR